MEIFDRCVLRSFDGFSVAAHSSIFFQRSYDPDACLLYLYSSFFFSVKPLNYVKPFMAIVPEVQQAEKQVCKNSKYISPCHTLIPGGDAKIDLFRSSF